MYFISLLLSLLNFFLGYFKIPTLCYFSFYLTLILIQPNILCSFCYFNTVFSKPSLCITMYLFLVIFLMAAKYVATKKVAEERAHIFDRSA